METELLSLRPAKETAFVEGFLAFASAKYESTPTIGWTAMIAHVTDPSKWVDLYKVARHTGQDAFTWTETDAWSCAWDEPTPAGGFVHATSGARREQLARKMEFLDFDPVLADKAIEHDLVIFINDIYAAIAADKLSSHPLMNRENFQSYLLAHEALHYVEDWTGKQLVFDEVPPWLDTEVMTTLNEFIESIGDRDVEPFRKSDKERGD